ncbi:MAG: ABC transporter permease [Segetibacter sp.]
MLIIGTIVVSKQVNFIQSRNLGYDKENLIYIPSEGDLIKKYESFKNEVLQMPGIQSISFISDNPVYLDQWTNSVDWDGRSATTMISFEHPDIGYDFAKTMKLQLVEGRDFSKEFPADDDGFLLNETAIKNIGYTNPTGKFITINGRRGKIIGVLKDFNFRSLHEPIKPMIMQFGERKFMEIYYCAHNRVKQNRHLQILKHFVNNLILHSRLRILLLTNNIKSCIITNRLLANYPMPLLS